jgi:hypothetical protein
MCIYFYTICLLTQGEISAFMFFRKKLNRQHAQVTNLCLSVTDYVFRILLNSPTAAYLRYASFES